MDVPAKPPVKLDLGAGEKVNEGFLRVGLEADHDVRCDLRSIPLPDEYADEAMAIHVIEHFDPWDVVPTLREWLRILKPGGLLVLELPDLMKCCRNYLQDGGAKPWHSLWGIYGDPGHGDPLMLHRFGYTFQTLAPLVREAGFIKLKHRNPQWHARRLNRDFRLEARRPE